MFDDGLGNEDLELGHVSPSRPDHLILRAEGTDAFQTWAQFRRMRDSQLQGATSETSAERFNRQTSRDPATGSQREKKRLAKTDEVRGSRADGGAPALPGGKRLRSTAGKQAADCPSMRRVRNTRQVHEPTGAWLEELQRLIGHK